MQNRHTLVAQLPVFVAVFGVFSGAFLLFFIQPLWGRHLVIAFGGTAAVWNVLLFVFQALLFGGYLLVFVAQFLKWQKPLLLSFIGVAFWQIAQPMPQLLQQATPSSAVLFETFLPLVMPVVLLSVATPFMQQFLGLKKGENRYHLYSFSNAGSFLALLAAPLLFLPFFELETLLGLWRAAIALYLVALCLVVVLQKPSAPADKISIRHQSAPIWFLWPFLSTGSLHAYSQYLNNELANLPLVWVVPIGAYLLSYVVAFTGALKPRLLNVFALVMLACAFAAALMHEKSWLLFGVHFTAFFAACLLAHGKLYQQRPPLAHMPLFYLTIAFAGMGAGLLNAHVFPQILPDTYEYPAYYAALFFAFLWGLHKGYVRALCCGGLVVLVGAWVYAFEPLDVLGQWRNFYGVMKVVKEGDLHVYYNNGTAHEFEDFAHNTHAPAPYLENIISHEHYKGGRVGVIGMGPGNTACYTRPDQTVDFYEINPLMLEMADNPKLFRFRQSCKRAGAVIFGDGRLAFPAAGTGAYSVVVNTAHNGFTLPLHLITVEAFRKYKTHLTADGILLMIVPVRYFSHHNALITTAQAAGFKTLYVPNSLYRKRDEYPYSWYAFYQTDKAHSIIDQALAGVWQAAYLQKGSCPILTDARHSFLQLIGVVGSACR